jgi:hypothetical protein
MSSLQEQLKDADPVAHEPPLSNELVQQMRQAVLTSARAVRSRRVTTHKAGWAVAGVAAVVALAVGVNRWSDTRSAAVGPVPTDGTTETTRQVQFATPGGTRVIWVFNADFEP